MKSEPGGNKSKPDEAVDSEVIPNKRYFSEAELTEMRKNHCEEMSAIDKKSSEFKALKKVRQAEIDELLDIAFDNRDKITKKFVLEDRDCWLIPDHEAGFMLYIDKETNEELFRRKLFPLEKQLHIGGKRVAEN